MNYFNNLPEDLQELIYKEEHKLKLNDIWNEIEERGWDFPFNKSEENDNYYQENTNGTLIFTLNILPRKLMSKKINSDFWDIRMIYECSYGECIYDLPKNKYKYYDEELEELEEREIKESEELYYKFHGEFEDSEAVEIEKELPLNLVYDEESEDESDF